MKKHEWPQLQFELLKDTITTVQMWTQIVGKIRLKKMPWINHSWHVSLYVSPVGLTTAAVPYENGIFQIEFDFIEHVLVITTSEGGNEKIMLYPRTVTSFYNEVFEKLEALGVIVTIYAKPNEVDPAIPFALDYIHQSYDKEQMHAFWKALVKMEPVFKRFRANFSGKSSPVHFFWGGFDLTVSRFSGRKAPKYETAVPNMPLRVMQESYSHEVCSAGFWAGSPELPQPVFYSYIYPTPAAFSKCEVMPKDAFFSNELGEFLLPYETVRNADDPEKTLMLFLQSSYEAAAETANWDRQALDFNFNPNE